MIVNESTYSLIAGAFLLGVFLVITNALYVCFYFLNFMEFFFSSFKIIVKIALLGFFKVYFICQYPSTPQK